MTTVGEPIEPEVWRWYYHSIGKDEAVIVDTWWQTETGGFLGSTPARHRPDEAGLLRPCGSRHPADHPRRERRGGPGAASPGGNIVVRNLWPGVFQTIWGQPERFVSTYYAKYNKDPKSTDWRDWLSLRR